MQDMVKKDFTPALFSYVSEVSKEALDKKKLLPSLPASYEEQIIKTLTKASEQIATALSNLSADTLQAEKMEEPLAAARYYHDIILSDMGAFVPPWIRLRPSFRDAIFHIQPMTNCSSHYDNCL